jgi:hypothetical protein
MTISQLSNLFNLIVQNDVNFKFYHYGYPSDMNINIQNNFDHLANTGRMFPYLLLLPPTLNSRAMENNTQAIYDTYNVEFLLTDTYGYQSGLLTYETSTTIEVENRLENYSKIVMQYLLQYSEVSDPPFNVGNYKIEFDPYRFTADTRSVRVMFDLVFPAVCDYENLDISFLPEALSDIGNFDYEANLNYCPILNLGSTVVVCTGIAGGLWDANSDLTDFIAEILAHPFYVGSLQIDLNIFVDSNNVQVGNNTTIGYALYCNDIDPSLTEIFYLMRVYAEFNTGGGVRTIEYTLNIPMAKPTLTDDYSTNLYICNEQQ